MDKLVRAKDRRLTDEVAAANIPDPATRSAALDRLEQALVPEPEPELRPQDYVLVRGRRFGARTAPPVAAPPMASILMEQMRANLGQKKSV